MKKGYILLEVLVASAISSFILAMVTTVVYQVNNSFSRMSSVSSIDSRILLVQHQMEKDLSGAFILQVRKEKKRAPKKEIQKPKTASTKNQNNQEKNTKQQQQKQFENVPLKNAFLSRNKGENLDLLTFITTNPIAMYNIAKPRIARVVYTILPDKVGRKEPPSFKLVRKEGLQLDFDVFVESGVRSYQLIKNIRSISVDYIVAVKKEQEQAAPAGGQQQSRQNVKQQEGQKPEYKTFTQWTAKEIESTKKQKPDFCTIKIELWDDKKKTSDMVEFSIYMLQGEQKEIQKQQKPKKTPTVKDKQQPSRSSAPRRSTGETRRVMGASGSRMRQGSRVPRRF